MQTTLYTKQLLVPADAFNSNPIATLQSYIGQSSFVEAYRVANGVTGDGNLIVQLYYRAVDVNRIYYICPKELEEHKLNHKTQLQYIIDNVLIMLPKNKEGSSEIIPIQVRPITEPTMTSANALHITSYFGRPLREVLSFNSTLVKSMPKSIPQLFEHTKPSSTKDMNGDVEGTLDVELTYPRLENVENEIMQIKKYMTTMNMSTQLLKPINVFEYHPTIPGQIPKAMNVAWITHYNRELKEFIEKYHFGLLFTIPARSIADLVVFVPSVGFNLTKEQLEDFERALKIDMINASNVAWAAGRK